MAGPLFGLETEYAVAELGQVGDDATRERTVARLMSAARSSLRYLGSNTEYGGLFLANGARLYVDAGLHPELSTPECMNPWDAVRYALAGDEILLDLARRATAAFPQAPVTVFKSNVDYAADTTWGGHESYLCTTLLERVRWHVLPHLISRVIFCGAGGFHLRNGGVEFTLSPRVAFLEHIVSPNSTSARGIHHLREEPLAEGGYHRLHLICGESLRSEVANFLRVGTTALIVTMIDAGCDVGGAVQVADPLRAMRAFASDPSCTQSVATPHGTRMTAIAIQRHFLAQAESQLARSYMPEWAGAVCREWRAMLDRLEDGYGAVSRSLDWAIKREAYGAYLARHGFTWEEFSPWSKGCTAQSSARMRNELFEIDARFAQLGPGSIFGRMAAQGVLDHHVPGVEAIDAATGEPPVGGRAFVRGTFIARTSGEKESYRVNWDRARDVRGQRALDLSDPFCTEERWVDTSEEFVLPPDPPEGPREFMEMMRRRIRERREAREARLFEP